MNITKTTILYYENFKNLNDEDNNLILTNMIIIIITVLRNFSDTYLSPYIAKSPVNSKNIFSHLYIFSNFKLLWSFFDSKFVSLELSFRNSYTKENSILVYSNI